MDCMKMPKDSSLVRVFHASPQAPAVDVYVNGDLSVENLKFMDFSQYIPLKEGDYNIDVYVAGTKENPVISQVLEIDDSDIYTVAATGNLDDLSLIVIEDSISQQPFDMYSFFRVVHLSPDAPAVDVLVNDKKAFEDIEFRKGSMYQGVSPGQYSIKIVLNSDGTVVLPLKITLKPNRIYTIYVLGNASNLSAIQSVDGNTTVCR
ncbi:DUF4397 domain-containing protein [Romboutsia lituseburensis]|uniref:DUF4397 domain-containing protein n=1 Tax=Romboutsia lituseburensis TaxID=1537 RepID=UPI00215AB5F7|nr:DUF4397 domain-containing protein [Romboutsia lituseburensis]MCR8746877.1 DUF4397 domain-containing protein [Romboutsia lituseburensis]